MDPVQPDSVWDTTVASLEPVYNATVTVSGEHDTYRPEQYVDTYLEGASLPAVDPAFSKMEYTLHLEAAVNEEASGVDHFGSVEQRHTAAKVSTLYGFSDTEGSAGFTQQHNHFVMHAADFNMLSDCPLPSVAGAPALFESISTRTNAGTVIEETERLDLITRMKHVYTKTPQAKANDSLFTMATVDMNEFGRIKPAWRDKYQSKRIGVNKPACFTGVLNPGANVSQLQVERGGTSPDDYATFLHTVEAHNVTGGSAADGINLRFVNAHVTSTDTLPGNLKPYLGLRGNVFALYKGETAQDNAFVRAAANRITKFDALQFIGYVATTNEPAVHGGHVEVGVYTKMIGTTPHAFVSGEEITKGTENYVIMPVTKVSYDIDIPVTHEIPSALFAHPQGNTVYVGQLGGLRMRWQLAPTERWFDLHEDSRFACGTRSMSYELRDLKFRFRTVTPSTDLQIAMEEAKQEGAYFDIVTYQHVAQPISQGTSDNTINLPSFTQRRAFALFAIPEYLQSTRKHSAKFGHVFTQERMHSSKGAKDIDWRTITKGASGEHGFRAWQWQIRGRNQPSHAIETLALSKANQGMLTTAPVHAQELAKALANVNLPVEDLRTQGGYFVIPRRLAPQGGFADLLDANPSLRIRFTEASPESFVMHCFCAHQRRITVGADGAVLVSQ